MDTCISQLNQQMQQHQLQAIVDSFASLSAIQQAMQYSTYIAVRNA